MNKYISTFLIATMLFSSNSYYGSTTATVTMAGAIIKSSHSSDSEAKKYKRKDCPVCHGKGWYMSGDGIKKIECNYCEPDQQTTNAPTPPVPSKDRADNRRALSESYRAIIK